jgi:hypothetical protein
VFACTRERHGSIGSVERRRSRAVLNNVLWRALRTGRHIVVVVGRREIRGRMPLRQKNQAAVPHGRRHDWGVRVVL